MIILSTGDTMHNVTLTCARFAVSRETIPTHTLVPLIALHTLSVFVTVSIVSALVFWIYK